MPVDALDEVTLNSAGADPAVIPRGDAIEWLVDNAAAYDAIIEAIGSARRSICLTQLAFDADCESYAPDAPPTLLLNVLARATNRHALDVRILLNASILVNTVAPLRAALACPGAGTVEVRGISRFPQLLHAKLLIVDDREAFLLGSPFVNGYWDDQHHRPADVRRPSRELGGRPLHDLSLRVEGEVVNTLRSLFDEWWTEEAAEGARARMPEVCRADAESGLRVTRTGPGRHGHTGILDSMIEGISGACDLLYIEHQYLSARPVVAAIVDALHRAPALEVIALVNQNPDITAYRGWQNARLVESGLRDHPRFGLFALWSSEMRAGTLLVNQVFMHSKVIIADDQWATVGSANIDGVSLHSYGDDFTSWLGQRIFADVRNFDVNLVLRGDDDTIGHSIAALRARLWNEHLGTGHDDGQRPQGGWLQRWRDRAAANISELNAIPRGTENGSSRSFVLPYSHASRPTAQLEDLGVQPRDGLRVCFAPSWLEVHCSPNWIRNMFT